MSTKWLVGIGCAVVFVLVGIPLISNWKSKTITISGPFGTVSLDAEKIKQINDKLNAPQTFGLAQFNQVQFGMTVEEVNRIFAQKGVVTSSYRGSTYPGSTIPPLEMTSYEWRAAPMASVHASFSGGKLTSKMQMGLK